MGIATACKSHESAPSSHPTWNEPDCPAAYLQPRQDDPLLRLVFPFFVLVRNFAVLIGEEE
jgi:hypothetical protein